MSHKKPSYQELESRLAEAEAIIATLRGEEVDAVVADQNVSLLRLKEAEVALREAEAKYRSIFETARDGIAINDQQGILRECNPAYCRMLGYSREELIGKPVKDNIHPARRGDFLSFVQRIDSEGATFLESIDVRKDGSSFPVEVCGASFVFEGQPAYLGIVRDITERKRAEQALRQAHDTLEARVKEALRESEARYRQLFATVSDAIMVFDAETLQFVDVNEAALRLYGYSRDEFLKLRHPAITAELEESRVSIGQTLAGELTRIPLRYHKRKDGTVFPVEISASTLALTNRRMLCGVVRDITERERIEERLRRSERLASVGALAAGIAHEVNNPVGGILVAARSALDEFDKGQQHDFVRKCLNDVIKAAKRCGRIVKSVLRFARGEPTEKWPNNINALVKRSLDLTRELVSQRGGAIELQLAERAPNVFVNPTEFEQVLINLIKNAIDAGGAGTRVTVRTERLENAVRITIADDGPGMSPEQMKYLFDPFYTTRQREGGVGLGLSVVHGIVEAHKGRIDVESAPGQGTAFTIELPC